MKFQTTMTIKKRFSLLLLFLFTIGFISCGDSDENDDNPEYHLELSKSSCEVMQERSITIDLTAHENTTLDIKNPALIEVIYTWELGSYKAKIAIKGKQKGETDIVVTDHQTGESATIKVKVTEYPMPRLAVEQPKGNIFDLMNLYLYNENSQPINLYDLSALCDSIVWTADGLNGSFRVFEHEEGEGWEDNRLTLGWGHCFKYPSEYKTYLTAWKDNKSISRYQLDISITDDKDFLAYNWSDVTNDSQIWNSYADVLKSGPDLMTEYGLNGTTPFAEVSLFNFEFAQGYNALYDYFCKLYSAPTYEGKTDKMQQLYNELFSEQKMHGHPIAIWMTERANIVLLLVDEVVEYPEYVVYAEPNKKLTVCKK